MTHDHESAGFKNLTRGKTAHARSLETVTPLSRIESVPVLRDGEWST